MTLGEFKACAARFERLQFVSFMHEEYRKLGEAYRELETIEDETAASPIMKRAAILYQGVSNHG